ncbi:fumble-domain-containing protein [Podospora conica]|nr:fumble-domain-containing protein [Schizothecium conicum]
MGLLSLTYRRPTYVERPPSMDGDQVSIGSGSTDGEKVRSVKSSTSSTIAGIPAALSFDRIIDGGTCPPCTTRDFMNYLIYIERSAENLQFFLWYRDYVKRFNEAKTSDMALAPEWTPAMEEEAAARIQKEHADKLRKDTKTPAIAIFKGTDFEKTPSASPQAVVSDRDPFSTPPGTPDERNLTNPTTPTVTIQPFRHELDRVIATYLAPGAPRQLNLSDREQKAALHALAYTTHPSALGSVARTAEATLRRQAHPNFIRWSICNGNPPRVLFARVLGAGLIAAGLAAAVVLTLSTRARGWRALAALGWVLGTATLVAAWKGMCVVLHGLHHRHVRPWELFLAEGEEEAGKGSFESFGSANSYEEEPWVVRYQKRNVVRKVFDREVWIREPALRQIQDTIFVQSLLCGVVVGGVLVAVFVAGRRGPRFTGLSGAAAPGAMLTGRSPSPAAVAEAPRVSTGSPNDDGTTGAAENGHETPNGTDTHRSLRVADAGDGAPMEVDLDTTLSHPGSVRINVKGAFIVDGEGSSTPSSTASSNGRGSPSHGHDTKDIRLPNHTAVVSHIAVDIGGTLAKLVYFSQEAHSTDPGGRLNFLSFESEHIDECLEFMRTLKRKHRLLDAGPSGPDRLCVVATGGGAYKYYDMIRDVLGVDVIREDEMECLIIGLDFFITEIPREVFTYSEANPMQFVAPSDNVYPYLLVNIGSGVSFLKVSGPREYERVGGTSLGGGTLWGLLSLLTGARTFDEMLDLASRGDNTKVDMLVGDIYGTDYGKIGLKSTTIASSFGKVFKKKRQAESKAEDSGGLGHRDPPALDLDNASRSLSTHHNEDDPDDQSPPFSSPDIARSLLYAISNNIGQIAFLQSQIHNLSHIYFGGSFIQGHPQTMNTLSYAIKFWSKGAKQAYFLRHEGYLGSVGAFLKRQPRNWGRRGSFEEAAALEARMRARAQRDEKDEA